MRRSRKQAVIRSRSQSFNANSKMKLAVVLILVLLSSCASVRDAKRAPDTVARLRAKCDAGQTSACVDMAHVQQACTGHAAFGGLNAEDVGNCSGAVRATDALVNPP